MKYRVGIFDPAFRTEGHFPSFNRYVYELLDSPNIEATFIDRNGQMRSAFAGAGKYSYLELPEPHTPRSYLPRKIRDIIARLSYWGAAYRVMAESFDLVIFTADPRDILMCMPRAKFPYAVIIMYPYAYVKKGMRNTIGDKIRSYLYRRFVTQASVRISTNEPPILADIARLLGMNDILWIPDIPAEALPVSSTSDYALDFLTIGTISSSKNHSFTLEAFKEARLPYSYLIAGKPLDATGYAVETEVLTLEQNPTFAIRGRFSYLGDEEYIALLRSASYLIFPYDWTRGNISSQVLHDTFSSSTPYIAPDIEPFRWYSERYGVGILYPEGDKDGLIQAIQRAKTTDPSSFASGFEKIQKDHSLEAIRQRFLPVILTFLERNTY